MCPDCWSRIWRRNPHQIHYSFKQFWSIPYSTITSHWTSNGLVSFYCKNVCSFLRKHQVLQQEQPLIKLKRVSAQQQLTHNQQLQWPWSNSGCSWWLSSWGACCLQHVLQSLSQWNSPQLLTSYRLQPLLDIKQQQQLSQQYINFTTFGKNNKLSICCYFIHVVNSLSNIHRILVI
jgi:hypothetical protein